MKLVMSISHKIPNWLCFDFWSVITVGELYPQIRAIALKVKSYSLGFIWTEIQLSLIRKALMKSFPTLLADMAINQKFQKY